MFTVFKQDYVVTQVRVWTDATTALWWIRTCRHRLKTFIANRVSMIQVSLADAKWGHVSSRDNPADCASRGLSATDFLLHPLWWHGPSWLQRPESEWPAQILPPPPENLPELRPSQIALVSRQVSTDTDLFLKDSNWGQLQRTVALVLRFIHNVRNPGAYRTGHLTIGELRSAEQAIVRRMQQEAFAEDAHSLANRNSCSSRLQFLAPFLDGAGQIRVGGRLRHSSLSDSGKHPWVLSRRHPLTQRLVEYYHRLYIHAGPQLLQSLMAQRYWLLAGRTTIRAVVRACIICFKARPTNAPPLMGDLPHQRVTYSRPFSRVGVDLAGPFENKVHTLRFAKHVKVYLCILVCMATKATHLEVVQALTSDSFAAALVRFACRRGNPSDVYCDQGTNFVGASREFRRNYKALQRDLCENPSFQRCLQERNIQFHFNALAAPHQGGLWEAAVKSAKHHLIRALHNQVLTLEQFSTLILRVEDLLNSRPIAPASSDPNDLTALTPGHFLIGCAVALPAEPIHEELPQLPVERWHRVQALAQSIWRRWQKEYLHTLQTRRKWVKSERNLQEGDLVLIHDPSLPPLSWRMGRVTKVHPGPDGNVRVATVRTTTGELQRPVVKLYPLPAQPSAGGASGELATAPSP